MALCAKLRWRFRRTPQSSSSSSTKNHQTTPAQNTTGRQGQGEEEYVPLASDYPTFPPPPPRAILADPRGYFTSTVARRRYAAPRGEYQDTPLYALYRFYEFVVLDDVTNYRNCLEAFWRQKGPAWAVSAIPDPADPDPERYAFLAACTYLIRRTFNARVKLGLDRSMPSIITPDEAGMLRNRPDHLRKYESVPGWAERVPRLEELLVVKTHDGEVLRGEDDERVDRDFLGKGILLWTPHVHFT